MSVPSSLRRTLWLLGRTILQVALAILTSFLLVAGLTLTQAGRDEARTAKAALLFAPADASDGISETLRGQLDRALALRAAGLVDHVIITGGVAIGDEPRATEVRTYLKERGFATEAIVPDDVRATRYEQARSAALLARQQGFDTLLVVAEPVQMLTLLKMTRDEGLETYGAPARSEITPAGIISSTGDYFRYVLLRR